MAVLFTDSGVGADANPIGGAYTTSTGWNALRRVSNRITGTTSGANSAWVNTVAALGDSWMECKMGLSSADTHGAGAMVRSNTATSGYGMQITLTDTILLFRYDSGSYNSLAAGSHTNNAGVDVYRIEAVGNQISLLINGSVALGPVTDSTYSTGRLALWTWDSPGANAMTDIQGGDFAAGAVKTINGLALASVKTINGLALASVKTWNGIDL